MAQLAVRARVASDQRNCRHYGHGWNPIHGGETSAGGTTTSGGMTATGGAGTGGVPTSGGTTSAGGTTTIGGTTASGGAGSGGSTSASANPRILHDQGLERLVGQLAWLRVDRRRQHRVGSTTSIKPQDFTSGTPPKVSVRSLCTVFNDYNAVAMIGFN